MDIPSANALLHEVLSEMKKTIVGQQNLLERLVIAICANGHVFLKECRGLQKQNPLQLSQNHGSPFPPYSVYARFVAIRSYWNTNL